MFESSTRKEPKKNAESMATAHRGFEFHNGILRPIHASSAHGQNIPLAVISTPQELSGVYPEAQVVEDMQSQLAALFAQYEVPIGLLHKLRPLASFSLYFILDDSTSMSAQTTMTIASNFLKEMYSGGTIPVLTRWDEQEDRIHLLLDFLCYMKTGSITIKFLNRNDVISLPGDRENCENWLQAAHERVHRTFSRPPSGSTPIYRSLQSAILMSQTIPNMIYLFTDGQPTDASPNQVAHLISKRRNAESCPITLVSCTDVDDEVAWMKEVDEDAPYVAEVDDYDTERSEVIKQQGDAFPFTRGLWIMCLLAAALDPQGLDALDESTPLSQMALGNLLGRQLTKEEHEYYLQHHPSSKKSCVIS